METMMIRNVQDDVRKQLSAAFPIIEDLPAENSFFYLFFGCENAKDLKELSMLRKKYPRAALIVLSSDAALVFSCFSYGIFDFLRLSHLKEDLQRVHAHMYAENGEMFRFSDLCISLRSLLYIESFAHTMVLHCEGAVIRQSGSIGRIEKALRGFSFLRIHRSYLINCRFLYSFDGREVVLQDGSRLPVGRTYRRSIEHFLDEQQEHVQIERA